MNRKNLIFVLCLSLTAGILNGQDLSLHVEKGDNSFTNPVFAGDYPDPSIIRDGDNYYVVHSSFEYYPGLLIWQSTDLLNWTPVTNALHTYIGSVWAPDMVKYKNKYYIYFPANNNIYVVAANSIEGPWSEPVSLNISTIDPGHFVDESGNRYLYFSNGSYVPLSDDGLSVTGEMMQAYSGWPIPREWTIECFCLEGPKVVKHDDYYFLTTAEGGTAGPATSHMIISARSKSPFGPWENSPYNPIERTADDSERWWSKGHGTIFEDKQGNWWMMFHAYEKGFYNMGRQTLLQPIEWTEDGWFRTPEGIKTEQAIKTPEGATGKSFYSISDNFGGSSLKPHWKFFGEYDSSRFQLTDSSLTLEGKGNSIGESSPLLTVPTNHSYIAEVELTIKGEAVGGLILFYNNDFHSGILADNYNVLANLRGWQFATEENVLDDHVYLRLINREHTVDMYYSTDGLNWTKTESSLEVSGMHHNVLSGFLSLRIGLFAFGDGSVSFRNFKYTHLK